MQKIYPPKIIFYLSLIILLAYGQAVLAVSVNLEVTASEGGGGAGGGAAGGGAPAQTTQPTPETTPLTQPAEQLKEEAIVVPPALPPEEQAEVSEVPTVVSPVSLVPASAPSSLSVPSGSGGGSYYPTISVPTIEQVIEVLPAPLQAPIEQAVIFVQQAAVQTQQAVKIVRSNPKVQKVMKEPVVDVTTKMVSTAAVGTAVASGAVSLMPLATSVSDFSFLPLRIFSLIGSIFVRRKRKNWGIVYDSITKQPLDPAYVVLKDKDGKEIDTRITDMTGRFGFLVAPGDYYIEANKTHYEFPSKKLLGVTDEIYDHLYRGELLKITDPSFININVPMDPVGFDWNEAIKNNYVKFDYRSEVIRRWLPDFLFLIGFVLTIVTWLLNPTSFNQALIWFFVILFLLRRFGFKQKNWGLILDKETKKPVAFANLKIFYANLNQQIHRVITDISGRYFALVEPGDYDLLVEEKVEENYLPIEKYRGIKAKNGLLNKDLFVTREEVEALSKMSSLATDSSAPPPTQLQPASPPSINQNSSTSQEVKKGDEKSTAVDNSH